jgi:DNA repair exonuclease SbcCD ATPase subunit
MQSADMAESRVTVCAEQIGGITETAVTIPPGVTVLAGRNATNRTSFLQTIMAAMGSNDVTLKGDAQAGRVQLNIDGERYERTLRRQDDSVVFGGEPYLDDSTLGDLFAFLLESNEARQAVVQQRDLRELIMRPVDTEEIQAEIDRLEEKREGVDDELATIDSLKEELPGLEQRKQELNAEIERTRAELAATEEELEAMEADVDQSREEKAELESTLDALRERRADLETVRSDIDIQQESIESLRAELNELTAERAELPETPMGDVAEIDQQLSRLRDRKHTLESELSELQDIIQFNEGMLDGEQTTIGDALKAREQADPTEQLVEDRTVCWTCGSEVEADRIEATVETVREVHEERLSEIRSIEEDIEQLQADKEESERKQQRRETLDQQIAETKTELETRQERLDTLREQREQLSEEIADLEAAVSDLESDDFSDVLERHRDANQYEFELGRLAAELDDVRDRIGTIETRLSEAEELRERREQLGEQLQRQRTRIDQIERQAVEEFNDRMGELLGMLNYENLARIWIERVTRTVKEGRQTVEQTAFELHVVRTTDSGTTYEDTIDHLSESEREVTGLTFALAGYLVHDVHERVPFMLLDSLEAIDADRLADLVDYFAAYSQYLVVALLPEDAQALSAEYTRISEI